MIPNPQETETIPFSTIEDELQRSADELTQLQIYVAQGGQLSAPDLAKWQAYLGDKLGAIYAEAEAEGHTEMAETALAAWNTANTLIQQAQIAPVALQLAVAMRTERDAALTAHSELETAVREKDYDHPLVSQLADELDEEHWEAAYELACETKYDDTFYEIAEVFSEHTGADTNDIALVMAELRDVSKLYGYSRNIAHQMPAITTDMLAGLATFFNSAAQAIQSIKPLRDEELQRRLNQHNQ